MKLEIKVQDVELFLGRLDKALQANKAELDRIETVVWKKENSFALFWNKHFGKWYAMTIYDKDLAVTHSIRYGFQRWDLQEIIYKQEQLKERLEYAIQSNSSVVFEDSDYKLLSRG